LSLSLSKKYKLIKRKAKGNSNSNKDIPKIEGVSNIGETKPIEALISAEITSDTKAFLFCNFSNSQ